jgi:hypothetical protein
MNSIVSKAGSWQRDKSDLSERTESYPLHNVRVRAVST